jgi:hypothetical protein
MIATTHIATIAGLAPSNNWIMEQTPITAKGMASDTLVSAGANAPIVLASCRTFVLMRSFLCHHAAASLELGACAPTIFMHMGKLDGWPVKRHRIRPKSSNSACSFSRNRALRK